MNTGLKHTEHNVASLCRSSSVSTYDYLRTQHKPSKQTFFFFVFFIFFALLLLCCCCCVVVVVVIHSSRRIDARRERPARSCSHVFAGTDHPTTRTYISVARSSARHPFLFTGLPNSTRLTRRANRSEQRLSCALLRSGPRLTNMSALPSPLRLSRSSHVSLLFR